MIGDTVPFRSSRAAFRARLLVSWLLVVALLSMAAAVPWFASFATQRLLVEVFTLFAIAMAWNLLAGYAGLVAIGQHVFIGVGAYSLFVLSDKLGLNPWLTLPLAALCCACFALLSAWPMFRLTGAYFAVGTWVLAEMMRILALNSEWLGAGAGMPLDAMREFDRWTRNAGVYWAALVVGAGALITARAVLLGPLGLALMSVRDAEPAASACGVPVERAKLALWLIAATITGTAGAIAYMSILQVTPDASFSVNWTAAAIFIAVLGGIGTLEGPIVGTILYFALRETFADYGTWYFIGLGALAITTMVVAPGGAWSLITERWRIDPFGVRRHAPPTDHLEQHSPRKADFVSTDDGTVRPPSDGGSSASGTSDKAPENTVQQECTMNKLELPPIGSASSIGKAKFASRIGLETEAWRERLASVSELIKSLDLQIVRVGFVDVHGHVRTRPIEASHFESAARNGVPFTSALLAMDSGGFIFKPIFSRDGGFATPGMGGAGDVLAVPDLSTFRVLPWADRTGWVLSDLYLSSGQRCPYDPRGVMTKACEALQKKGLSYVGGVEIECHVFRMKDTALDLADCAQPPTPLNVLSPSRGYQHMSELIYDELQGVIGPIRDAIKRAGLPLRTLEAELGPGQLEITLDPLPNLEAADAVILLRSAVKQTAKRLGMVATFMAKPGLANVFSSGWHLHQSLADAGSHENVFASSDQLLSSVGLKYVGGVLNNSSAGTAFSNPTINGYKRLNANPLTPKRAVWSHDNRAAMLRIIGGPGDRATHVENRSGEPAANPYLYMASQIFAGLDGIAADTDPGAPLDDPYLQTDKPPMPTSLMEAVDALDRSALFREAISPEFVDYYVSVKRHEISRFLSAVTDWEHREYFEAF